MRPVPRIPIVVIFLFLLWSGVPDDLRVGG
jgi:hypothetical protein